MSQSVHLWVSKLEIWQWNLSLLYIPSSHDGTAALAPGYSQRVLLLACERYLKGSRLQVLEYASKYAPGTAALRALEAFCSQKVSKSPKDHTENIAISWVRVLSRSNGRVSSSEYK